ncbi:hypothetical protein P7C73_g4169, partial [Tremellales sp. Uapishka_1]
MSIRPLLKKSFSSPNTSVPRTNSTSPYPSPPLNPISPSDSTSHISIQLPRMDSHQHLTSALHTGHIPRARTFSSGQGPVDGKYRRKVGFEAFEAGPDALFAYTCAAKSEGYKRSRSTRVFAVAVSSDETGLDALDWLMAELVEDGDEVVAIRVIDLDEGERATASAQEEFREDAHTLLATVLDKNNEEENRRISVVVEFVAGRVTEMLLKMIALYRPDSLVVGTKGQRTRLQSWGMALGGTFLSQVHVNSAPSLTIPAAPGMGSVSRFAVSHSPVPVIVVRPERKVKKTLAKRQNDPKRGQYAALVGPDGMALSRSRSRDRSEGARSRTLSE